jgi:TPP-dependent 2-oxoacid decarboxylase
MPAIDAPYSVTDYLLDRLAEAGVDRLFGVPGDFTLGLLDYVENHAIVEWVGCANELGAGYAADGYARIRGLGAVCTTFGVGELSAINAVAGSYAEHVPVIHLVGAPTTATQAAGRATHHSLGDGDFRHFARMTAEVTCAQASLTVDNATDEIDRVLSESIERRLPGYLLLPADVAAAPSEPPSAPLPSHPGVTSPQALDLFRDAAAALLADAGSVAVLADILIERMGAQGSLDALLAHELPHATLLWGRRVVDESSPSYVGTYMGAVSTPAVKEAIEGADVLILAGVQFTDLTSGFFSQRLPDRLIDVGARSSRIGGHTFAPLSLSDAVEALTSLVAEREFAGRVPTPFAAQAAVVPDRPGTRPLDQAGLWDIVSAHLTPGDIVLADQGTAFYGMGSHQLPHDVIFIGQPLWAAIGYTLPASVGAALAAPSRRTVILIGDGAAQLTIADLGTLLRNRIPAIVLVVNNAGYTVERAIHGADRAYNDIAQWDWAALATALGPDAGAHAVTVRNGDELNAALESWTPDRLTLIEVVVPALDVPPLLAALAERVSSANARQS